MEFFALVIKLSCYSLCFVLWCLGPEVGQNQLAAHGTHPGHEGGPALREGIKGRNPLLPVVQVARDHPQSRSHETTVPTQAVPGVEGQNDPKEIDDSAKRESEAELGPVLEGDTPQVHNSDTSGQR